MATCIRDPLWSRRRVTLMFHCVSFSWLERVFVVFHALLCFSCDKSAQWSIVHQQSRGLVHLSLFSCLEITAPVRWLSCKAVHHCSWVHLHSILWHRAQIVQALYWFSTVKHTFEHLETFAANWQSCST